MPFRPVEHAAKVVVFGHTGEREWSFTLWFGKPGFSSLDMIDLVDGIDTWIDDKYQVPLVAASNFDKIVCYDMRTPDGEKVVKTIDYPGLHSDVPVSVSNALVVSFYGARRGKWNAGRNFVPGMAEDNVNEYRVEAPVAENVRLVYQDLIDNPIGTWIWSIASRVYEGEPRPTGVLAAVTSVVVRNTVLGTQKRRLRKT